MIHKMLLEIEKIYIESPNYDLDGAFAYFNKFKEEDKVEIINFYLNNFDSRYDRYEEGNNFSLSMLKVFTQYEHYNEIINNYIEDPKFNVFKIYQTPILGTIKFNTKKMFFKNIKTAISEKIFLNNLHLDFTSSEKTEILKIMKQSGLNFTHLSDKKIIIEKIGYFDRYLDFDFNRTTEEEILFFEQNILNLPKEKVIKKFVKNFFKYKTKKFNYKYFLSFISKNIDLYPLIKQEISFYQNDYSKIIEMIDTRLMLENF